MNNFGTVEIITFRANRAEHPYLESIKALFRGTSTGHIAMRLVFRDSALYDQYIRDNNVIQHRMYHDPKDHSPIYEVYVSFWPDGSWSPWHHTSALKPYHYDCVQSGNYSAFEYNPQMAAYIQPLQRHAVSSIPGFSAFGSTVITLPPSIILHTSRLGLAFGDKTTMTPNSQIIKLAEQYCARYHLWRAAFVREQDLQKTNAQDQDLIAEYRYYTKQMHNKLSDSQKTLAEALFPEKAISTEEFYTHLAPFITYGYPERDIVSLPLVKNNLVPGVQLEPMLKFIHNLSNFPQRFPYHVLSTNCARIIYDILMEGCKQSKYSQLQKTLLLPWFIRWFNLTITPAFLIRHLVKLQIAIEQAKEKYNYQAEDSTSIIASQNHTQSQQTLTLNTQPTALRFSTHNTDLDEDDLPTTRIGLYARMLDNVTQYLRQ